MIRTLLIGLDGCTFDVLDPLMASGHMPFLRSFFAGGVRAPLRTIVPPLTPPAWTSLMTGRTPGQHGVFDFFSMESAESRHIRFFSSQDVQQPTIWSLASLMGLRITSLNFPAMFPTPRLPGCIVPGWVPWRQLRLACWPSSLFERLKQIPGFNPRELAMDIKLEERATEGCSDHAELEPWIQLHIRRERNWLEVVRSLTREDPSEFTAVLFDGVDKLQHLCWRFLSPDAQRPLREPWEFRVRNACLEYFRSLDGILAELCTLAGSEANIVVASDHGFGPTWEVFYVNAWLASKGYLTWSKSADGLENAATLGVGQVARHTWMIDWSRTTAFTATPTSNGIHIVRRGPGQRHGIAPEDYHAFRQRLIEDLSEVRDPVSGEAIIAKIWTREEAYSGPHCGSAPDLTLALRDGGLVSILPAAEFLQKRADIAGTHRPVGVFAARGPAIRSGVRAAELCILDVAPSVLYLLGLPLLESFQGRLPEEIIKPGWLKAHPPSSSPYTQSHDSVATRETFVASPGITPQEEQLILDRMRELGYVD